MPTDVKSPFDGLRNKTPKSIPDFTGKELKQSSSYQPTGEERKLLAMIRDDYSRADSTRHNPYEEFNGRSLVEIMNDCQTSFNSYIPSSDSNPEAAWRSNVVRPMTRNKCISIASHLTQNVLVPNIFAQNDNDEEDRDAALVMRDLVEWSDDQSNWDMTFITAVIAAIVNPAVIIYEGYHEVTRTIKDIQPDGTYKLKTIIDETFSGFCNSVVPLSEMYIANAYEANIQKQPFLIWRRVIDYSTAKLKYGHYAKFNEHVAPGIRVLYSDNTDFFYNDYDQDLQEYEVEEVIYYNKNEDLEIIVINGVIVTDSDRPIQRKDKQYPFAKSGYEYIDEGRFFYYKSLVDKLWGEQQVIDTLYRMIIDGSYLSVMPPVAIYGGEEVDSSIFIPGAATSFQKVDTRIEPLSVGSNLSSGLSTLQLLEQSASESSMDAVMQGQKLGGRQTAFEIARQESNAKTILGLFGKMIGFLVKDFGQLRTSTILQYLTVGESENILGGTERLKFKSFLIPDRLVNGKKKTRKIEFSMDMPMEKMSKKELEDMQFQLLDREGGMESDKEIMLVNPTLFRELKFSTIIAPDFATPKSEALEKALNLEAYDRAIMNPLANQEAVYRDFLIENYRPGETDKYVKDTSPAAPGMADMSMLSQLGGAGGKPKSPGEIMAGRTQTQGAAPLKAPTPPIQ